MPCVLLVDDDAHVRRLLKVVLEDSGYSVLEARNGREALRVAQPVDVMLTDMVMPETEGLELIRASRRLKPALPIVAMSGASFGDKYLTIARHLGADRTLEKPIMREQLLIAIDEALKCKRDAT